MLLQVAFFSEFPATVGAIEWLFTGVCSLMLDYISLVAHEITIGASVLVIVKVLILMHHQMTFVCELHHANGAFVELFTRFSTTITPMCLQMTRCCKFLTTLQTFAWFSTYGDFLCHAATVICEFFLTTQ